MLLTPPLSEENIKKYGMGDIFYDLLRSNGKWNFDIPSTHTKFTGVLNMRHAPLGRMDNKALTPYYPGDFHDSSQVGFTRRNCHLAKMTNSRERI